METLIEWAVREGKTRLAIWGGDGSFSRAINALYQNEALAKVQVTLVPSGTCNDFARKLKLSAWNEPQTERLLDVGLITAGSDRRTFINNSGFGRSEEARRRKPSALRDILEFQKNRISINGSARDVFLGMICNAPYFSGGLHFAENVEPDDGVLNSFFVSPQNKAKLVLKFIAARLGSALMDNQVVRLDKNVVAIEAETPFSVQADGEWAFKDPVCSVSFSVLNKKLRFLINEDM